MSHTALYRYSERCKACDRDRFYTVTEHELGQVEAFLIRWCACPREELIAPASPHKGDPEPA